MRVLVLLLVVGCMAGTAAESQARCPPNCPFLPSLRPGFGQQISQHRFGAPQWKSDQADRPGFGQSSSGSGKFQPAPFQAAPGYQQPYQAAPGYQQPYQAAPGYQQPYQAAPDISSHIRPTRISAAISGRTRIPAAISSRTRISAASTASANLRLPNVQLHMPATSSYGNCGCIGPDGGMKMALTQ